MGSVAAGTGFASLPGNFRKVIFFPVLFSRRAMRKAMDSSSFQPIFVDSGIDCLFGTFYGQISPVNLCSSVYIARIYTQNHEQIKKYKKLTELLRGTVVKYIS